MNKYIDKYLNHLLYERNYSKETVRSYSIDLSELRFFIEREEIEFLKFDKQDAKNYMAYLYLKRLSKKSVVRHISSCRSFFKYLLNDGLFEYNPFMTIKNIKREKKLPEVLFFEEIDDIVSSMEIKNEFSICFERKNDKLIILNKNIELFCYNDGVIVFNFNFITFIKIHKHY